MRGTTKPTSKNDAIASFEGDRRRPTGALGDADHRDALDDTSTTEPLGEVIDLRRAGVRPRVAPQPREVVVNGVNDGSADAVCLPVDE
jgi:hypothetical protein